MDNHPQVSIGCICPHFSNAHLKIIPLPYPLWTKSWMSPSFPMCVVAMRWIKRDRYRWQHEYDVGLHWSHSLSTTSTVYRWRDRGSPVKTLPLFSYLSRTISYPLNPILWYADKMLTEYFAKYAAVANQWGWGHFFFSKFNF